MNFNSGAFLIFLPVVVLVHWLLPKKWRNLWLLLASYFFYMYWNPLLILLLLTSTAVDYCVSLGMKKYDDRPKTRKLLLLISVFVNLGLLFFFKYWDFFAGEANRLAALLSIPYTVPKFSLILPVGISFYTFQTMSYTIDVYRKEVEPERDIVTFALYVTFFPQLVAGPIESPKNLLPQLRADHVFSNEDLKAGVRLLLCGFFRKCVVADCCGIYVNAVFSDPAKANGLAVVLASALFCFQMYCDFAGYSEIAMGSARLVGVRLMKNFDRPYLSQSYGEFFRRWHISLNRWFTQYVYIPLGGSRKGPVRRILNTVIVFALCGLWHGARWTYVLWGLYAAFWVCLESVVKKPMESGLMKSGVKLDHPATVFIRRIVMFLIFIPAALLFRAESTEQIGVLIGRIFSGGFSVPEALGQMGLSAYGAVSIALILLSMNRLHVWGQHDIPPAESERGKMNRILSGVLMTVVIALAWLALLATEDSASFAYFQF